MSRPLALPALLLRLLCAVALLWGGMTRSNPAFSVAPMAADLALFAASPRGRTLSGQSLSVCGDTNMLS